MALSRFVGCSLLIAFVLIFVSLELGSAQGLHTHQRQQPYKPLRAGDLQLGEPEEVAQSDGGSIRGWRYADVLRRAQVDMYETALEENGLLLPKYIDAPSVAYVMKGNGMVGIAYPWQGEFRQKYYVRRVRQGDVIAVPQGVVFWLYNDGKEQQRVMCVSETSKATNPGEESKPFHLSGAKERDVGGLLHGFSEDTLAQAFGVDKSTVRKLRTSQKATAITKTRRRISLPLPDRERDDDNAVATEFTFAIDSHKADLVVRDGGWLSMVTRNKLPVLEIVGLSALRVNLDPNAMVAPSWSANSHQVLRVLDGHGRIEASSNDGERLLQTELNKNDVIVIPKFYPSTIIAGEDGLEFIKILTNDSPVASYFAGANSVYKQIPAQVVAEAFGIDLEEEMDIRRQRTHHEVILPACGRKTRSHPRDVEEEDCQRTHIRSVTALLE